MQFKIIKRCKVFLTGKSKVRSKKIVTKSHDDDFTLGGFESDRASE